MRLILVILALLLFADEARAIDSIVPTITGTADITSRRTQLIQNAWGASQTTLPTTQSVVTANVSLPVFSPPMTNVLRVDSYASQSLLNGAPGANASLLYVANAGYNGKVIILNPGHATTCSWPADAAQYRMTQVLQGILLTGYSVFAMNMPYCGVVANHNSMFTSFGNTAMSAFLEPAVQVMNYWDAHAGQNCQTAATSCGFTEYDFAGLSGGGWTTTVMMALDPRLTKGIIIAGSWPGINWVGSNYTSGLVGDQEQLNTPFYTIAGYADMYVMGSYGAGRRVYQVYNYQDDCCFGAAMYNGSMGTLGSSYGYDYPTFIGNIRSNVQAMTSVVSPMNYTNVIDWGPSGQTRSPPSGPYVPNGSTVHQISAYGQSLLIGVLQNTVDGGGAIAFR